MDAGMGDHETEEGKDQSPNAASAFESSALAGAPSTSSQKAATPRTLDSLKSDKQLQCYYFNSEHLKKWQLMHIPSDWNEDFAFPTPDELRAFADVAYDKKDNEDHKGWKVVMTAESSVELFWLFSVESFFARVYFNDVKRQLLVAIKGTGSLDIGAWAADAKNVLMGKEGLQVDSVFTFGEKLRELINGFKTRPQVIITGHSLGGFLAQVLTFTLRNCGLDTEGKVIELFREDYGLNTIVFDSPAAFEQIKRIANNDPLKASCVNLPITNFVIKQNWINCNSQVGPHVGTVISLSAEEDLKASTKWKISEKHGLKYFKDINLDGAFQVIHLGSAELVNYDSKRIPLLQFSQREQDALRLLPLTTTIQINSVNLVPSSSFTIQENEVVLKEDEGTTTFIPRLRVFVHKNDKTFRALADGLRKQFNLMMQDLLNAHSKAFLGLDLQLKPEIAQRYQEMATGSRIKGLKDEREQMLFARILKNSIGHFLFMKFDDFIGVDELRRETWLQLYQGTLMLCQANGHRICESQEFMTRILYIGIDNTTKSGTPEDSTLQLPTGSSGPFPAGPNEVQPHCETIVQMPLTVTNLDEKSKTSLGKKKISFFGNEVEAREIFIDRFEESNVKDIIDFNCDRNDEKVKFYFSQELVGNISKRSLKFKLEILAAKIRSSTVKTFLLSCDAGMGKTTNLKLLEKHLREKLNHFWIVRLELGSCSESLHKWKIMDQQADLVKAAISLIADEIFKKTEASNAELIRKIFYAKVAAGEVIFVLDAVDEVCPEYSTETLDLLRQLKKTGLKMVVATRPQEEKEVAEALGIEGEEIFRLQLIEAEDQAKFICEFWASKGISNVLETAQSLLDQLRSRLPAGVPGIPLSLRIIAESFPDGKLSEEFLKHGDLYKTLFEISIKEAIKIKLGQDDIHPKQKRAHLQMAEDYSMLLQKVAVADEIGEKISLSEDAIEFFNCFPFAIVVGTEVLFAHKTYQEYLVALQLVRVMNGEKVGQNVFLSVDQMTTILGNKGNKEIRAFADTILSYTKFSDCEYKVTESLRRKVQLICLQEQHLNIFKWLCNKNSIRNDRLGEGETHPLELVLGNETPKREFAEFLFLQDAQLEDAVNTTNYRNMLDSLIRMGLNKPIEDEWKLFKAVLAMDGYNPLVTAARSRNIECARFFIEQGADVNKKDGDDTPIIAAIANKDFDMINLLYDNRAQ